MLINRNRQLLVEAASVRDLHAFNVVSGAVWHVLGQPRLKPWICEIANAVGATDLMDAFSAVVFHASTLDAPLGMFANVMIALTRNVPECMIALCRDPLAYVQQR